MLCGEHVDESRQECRGEEAMQSVVGELSQCCDLSHWRTDSQPSIQEYKAIVSVHTGLLGARPHGHRGL